jgi:uncharacterized protein YqcC (DUF446 family)
MSKVTAYHPTKGERRFAKGVWDAMGPDKQGFTERAPMPDDLKGKRSAENIELERMAQAGEINAATPEQVAAVYERAIDTAANKRGRKKSDV